MTSALDLRQAESLTAAAQATLAQQRRLRALDVNALTQLVGQPLPEALLAAPTIPAAQSLREVPVGMPSDLLERRPDIRQAEQQLIAANANIGAARAAFSRALRSRPAPERPVARSRACSKAVLGVGRAGAPGGIAHF